MNKRGDAFQQQFNRAVFASAGSDLLPSITSRPKDGESGKTVESHPPGETRTCTRMPSFKFNDGPSSGKASPSRGIVNMVKTELL